MDKLKQLLELDVSAYTEKKGNLTYLSWANAWREFIKVYPDATYEVRKDEEGRCWFGSKEMGYMVYTTVSAGDLTHEMWLPVMDHRNKAVKEPDTFLINKTVMRCLTKNLAMFGLGLYIFSGEDLPESEATGAVSEIRKAYAGLLKRFGQEELNERLGLEPKQIAEIVKSGDADRLQDLATMIGDLQ